MSQPSKASGPSYKVLYFAWLREKTGMAEEIVQPPHDTRTVGDLISWLKSRDTTFEQAFSRPQMILAAIDKRHAKADAPIAGAREIAFFPPVTGG